MNAVTVQIIAVIVQMLPLILIPLLLKGLLDAIPVLGKFASNALNKSNKMAGQYAKDSGFFGRRRAEYMNNQRGLLGAKIDPKTNRTFGNRFQSYKRASGERIKSIEEAGNQEYRERIANNDSSYSSRIARRAHDVTETQELRGKVTDSRFENEKKAHIDNPNSELGKLDLQRRGFSASAARSDASTESRWKEATAAPESGMENTPQTLALNQSLNNAGLDRDKLVREAHETSGFAQRGSTADNRRVQDYSDSLTRTLDGSGSDADKSLLDIAGGSVSVQGQRRAQAAAVDAGFKIFAQNTAAARSLMQKQMSDQQLKIIQSTKKNEFDEPLDAQDNVIHAPNTILEKSLMSNDMNEVLAARDEFMTQGQAGVMSVLRTIGNIEREGGFKNRQEILTQLKRTQLSEHGKPTKENATFAVAWAQGADSMDVAKLKQGRFDGLTDDELANQSTTSLLVGVANGSIDQTRAERILSDDKLRSKYDKEATQILQMVKDHGAGSVTATWNPDDGKLWKDEKESSNGPAATYAVWRERHEAARVAAKGSATAPDPNLVAADEPEPTDDIEGILPGDSKVPAFGSPTPVLKQFADKAGSVSRMSRKTFDEFRQALQRVPSSDIKPDNDDLRSLVSQVNSEIERRNTEAQNINGQTIPVNVPAGYNVSTGTYRSLNMPPMPAPEDDGGDQPSPQSGQARGNGYPQKVSTASLAEELRQASTDFGVNLGDGRDINSYDDQTRAKMFATVRSYRQSIRSAQNQPSGAPSLENLRNALRQDMDAVANNETLGNS